MEALATVVKQEKDEENGNKGTLITSLSNIFKVDLLQRERSGAWQQIEIVFWSEIKWRFRFSLTRKVCVSLTLIFSLVFLFAESAVTEISYRFDFVESWKL